jgi:protein-S-isoprenylcysteine O-methyltransferase Ste14
MKIVYSFILRHRQTLFNIFLFAVIGQYIARETQVDAIFKNPALIDVTFFIHNLIFLAVILFRREYVQLDSNWLHWLVAILSFFSGLFFVKTSISEMGIVNIAEIINFFAILSGIAALLSLGRSFGIVPAVRKVRTGGLYRIVRHPMFVSDMLFKIPLVLKYLTLYNLIVLAISVALYILRASYEEEILIKKDEYRQYVHKVKYRFIPYLY